MWRQRGFFRLDLEGGSEWTTAGDQFIAPSNSFQLVVGQSLAKIQYKSHQIVWI